MPCHSFFLHTIYRNDKMYEKIDKMIKDLEIRRRTPNTIKNMGKLIILSMM